MLPDYIIYDELKQEREKKHRNQRPRVEIEQEKPSWPESEFDGSDEQKEDQQESDRGVEIIQI